jgi:hypothetical protein
MFDPNDAIRHTKKANSAELQRTSFDRFHDQPRSVRTANAVIRDWYNAQDYYYDEIEYDRNCELEERED